MFALPAGGGVVLGDLSDATRDAIDVACVGATGGVDVYFTLTPASAGTYVLDTCGSGLDTVLSLHTACPTGGMNQVTGACNDDACGLQSRLVVSLPAGQTFILRVGTYDGNVAPGPFTLNVAFTGVPMNDQCGSGVPMLTANVPTVSSNAGAGTDVTVSPATLCGTFSGSGGGADVWYRFKPASTGSYTISTCGSAIDTVLSLHAACPGSGSDVLVCNDDAGPTLCPANRFASTLTWALEAGRTYFIRVAGYRAGGPAGTPMTGAFTIVVQSSSAAYGACCDGAGMCQVALATACANTYAGDSTTCGPATCGSSPGACCIGTTCTESTSVACASAAGSLGSQFVVASACNAPGVRVVPCCHADFDKDGGIGVQDIFAYLNAWFGGSPYAAVEGDGVRTPDVQDVFTYLNLWFAGGC